MSSVINGNTDGPGKFGRKLGFLELGEGETSSEFALTRVFLSATMNDRSQKSKGPGVDSSGLIRSLLSSDLLMSGLVEEAFNASHPVLSEMRAL